MIFKLGWLACILFAAALLPEFAVLAVAIAVLVHLARAPVPVKEALFLLSAGAVGLAWETMMLHSGLITYPGSEAQALLAPYWIVAMWVLFATTINHGFRWLKRNWAVASIFGLLGGPMAFYAGSAAGAAELGNPIAALAVIGAGWAILLPLLTLIADTIIDSALLEPESRSANKKPASALEPRLERTSGNA
ncbi:MAG: DUF2878 domain-containing protein [Xanthomonadales bacterium]|nr:DUF2878 domain-containing protein [Xanthomonadales bacterium]